MMKIGLCAVLSVLFGVCFSFAKSVAMVPEMWDGNPLHYHFDGTSLTAKRGAGHALIVSSLPYAKEVDARVRFRTDRVTGEKWAIAGLGIYQDERNYWHLALAQKPKELGSGPFFELAEMRNGSWLAHTNLQVKEEKTHGLWKMGGTYDFRLRLSSSGIEGEIRQASDGKLLYRKSFAFNAPAVTSGTVALHLNGGFLGSFSRADAEMKQIVPKTVPVFPPYQCDQFVSTVQEPATGFFRVVQKPDGRWWTIDPLGRGMVLLGIDHCTFWGHWCEKLGYSPHHRKNQKKYPSKAEWETEALGRLKKWGFNFLGAGCDPDLKHRGLAHTIFLSIGDKMAYMDEEFYITPNEHRPCSAFPNVFHPDFEGHCAFQARRQCAPNKNDPWLFGYFIDNELAWWGRGEPKAGLFDQVMLKPADHTAKIALLQFLKERVKGDLAAFNRLWKTDLANWDGFFALKALPHGNAQQLQAKADFLVLCAERYFRIASEAIRREDPNHLVMGARFAGTGGADPLVWQVAGKYCDVVTFNCYPWADIDRDVMFMDAGKNAERLTDHFAKFYGYVNRPMLITEWSFPALDSGLPCTHGAGQRFETQRERTHATELFAKTMLSLPFLLGYDYFMWVDEPALGISTPFPENTNYGLINEDGVPYPLITDMFAKLHREVGKWRMQPPPPEKLLSKRENPAVIPVSTCLSRLSGTGASEPVRFAKKGDVYRLTSPCGLVMSGKIGDGRLVSSISLHGKEYGAYNAMLSTKKEVQQWIESRRLEDVQFRSESGNGVLELSGLYGDPSRNEAFRVVHRITVLADRPIFLCEFLRAENIGKQPISLYSLYFRFWAKFKDVKTMDGVPNLWSQRGGGACSWFDASEGLFYGTVSPLYSGVQSYFWTNPNGGQHPDSRYELGEVFSLQPGKTFTPAQPLYTVGVLGEGGEKAWRTISRGLQADMKTLK